VGFSMSTDTTSWFRAVREPAFQVPQCDMNEYWVMVVVD
jgi:hypothetical protein